MSALIGRRVGIALGALGIGAAATVIGAVAWRQSRTAELRRFAYAERLVQVGRCQEALEVIAARGPFAETNPSDRPWLELTVRALAETGAADALRGWHYQMPSVVETSEKASLLAARALVVRNDHAGFEKLRAAWKGRTDSRAPWLILEADSLLRQGLRTQALAVLSGHPLPGAWESVRRVRLALLHASEPAEAWRQLQLALQANPDDSLARLFRAQLLEAGGRRAEALLEYRAASQSQPANAALCDQLAEFYRRAGAFQSMLDTWADAEAPGADFIDLKLDFWRRVVASEPQSNRASPAEGPLRPLVQAMREMDPDGFWDDRALELHTDSHRQADRRPEAHWLRVLELLRMREFDAARSRLEQHAGDSLAPELHRALLMTLNYQLQSELDPNHRLPSIRPRQQDAAQRHSFLVALDELHASGKPPSPPLALLLRRPDAAALCCLAAGWSRAAVLLRDPSPFPHDSPPWAAYGMTRALRLTRGPAAARDFAAQQPHTPALQLAIAELTLELEGPRECLALLETLRTPPGSPLQSAAAALAEAAQAALQPDGPFEKAAAQP